MPQKTQTKYLSTGQTTVRQEKTTMSSLYCAVEVHFTKQMC